MLYIIAPPLSKKYKNTTLRNQKPQTFTIIFIPEKLPSRQENISRIFKRQPRYYSFLAIRVEFNILFLLKTGIRISRLCYGSLQLMARYFPPSSNGILKRAYTGINRYKPRIYYILIFNQNSAYGADGG